MSALRRDWPLYVVVTLSLGLALFWPFSGVAPAQRFDFDDADSPWLLSGWSRPERTGAIGYTWSVAPAATLRLPVEGRRDRTIVVRGWPNGSCSVDPQVVAMRLNGRELGRLELENRALVFGVAAPADAFRPPGEENVLVLEHAFSCPPPNGDPRRLGVAYDWIEIRELR